MEISTLNMKSVFSRDKRQLDCELSAVEMPLLIERMKQNLALENSEINSIVLIRNPDKKIVLTALHEGTEIISSRSKEPITLQVIEGKLNLQNGKESITLGEDQFLTIDERRKFKLTSLEETVFLLTILTGSDSESKIGSGIV
jgi:quercetin dioxygenase-like cupin family protein